MAQPDPHDAAHPAASPWPSVMAALAIAAALAGGVIWHGKQDLGAVHGATRFHAIDATLATAGSLLPGAQTELKAAGYEVVIDLRGPQEQGVAEARGLAEAAGLRYLNLPVGGRPTVEEFAAFSRAFAAERGRRTLVHCSSNKRASAFVMLHRVVREGVPRAVAQRDMDAVWQPRKGWHDFIEGVIADPPPADPLPPPST